MDPFCCSSRGPECSGSSKWFREDSGNRLLCSFRVSFRRRRPERAPLSLSLSLCARTHCGGAFPLSLSVHVATDSTTGSLNALYSSEYIECPVDNVGGRCCLGMRAVSRWWFGRVPQVIGGLYPNSNRIESNPISIFNIHFLSDPIQQTAFLRCVLSPFFSVRDCLCTLDGIGSASFFFGAAPSLLADGWSGGLFCFTATMLI